ncbi:hypothetical protein PVL30_005012 [Lodderomyces elongisporus]|uniref:uncharacterized protein n=1 Tax=Lodderomyces elongisporus TaxID=36914 RepID=UPI0029256F33|nr:uncharacterized protein PVL30_004755 [Lodderomyces elongisporus]XP_060975625.1 uncharacterized protein PVL30_005012 [Lodderomyces elongisporus]WLF80961.1 hypothetical protein PVL30_004755 [Lodderomyces elongisporus]WLF81215.1 hypothetical protein PVL30_005012 [Lodderomyces elongisporus]
MSSSTKDSKTSNPTPRSINPGPSKPDLAGVDSSSISGQSISTSGRADMSEGEDESPGLKRTEAPQINQVEINEILDLKSEMMMMQEQMKQMTAMFKAAMIQTVPQLSTPVPARNDEANKAQISDDNNSITSPTDVQMKVHPEEHTFSPGRNFPTSRPHSLASPLTHQSRQSGTPSAYGSDRSVASYDGILYHGEVVHSGFWVEGHEEACQIINEARQRYPHGEDVRVIPYIRVPDIAVEKAFMAYYDKLLAKQGRTQNDNMALGQYDIAKRVPLKFSDEEGFMFWLKSVLWHKHTYGVPDKLIINELRNGANLTKSESLKDMIEMSCKSEGPFEQPVVDYLPILGNGGTPPETNQVTDVMTAIHDALKKKHNPRVKMTIIGIAVKKYLRITNTSHLAQETWISIFKNLFERMGSVMDQIIMYMTPEVKIEKPGRTGPIVTFEDASIIKIGLGLLKNKPNDKIIQGVKSYDLTFERIWDAVNATFQTRMHLISDDEEKDAGTTSVSKGDKSQKTTKCNFCGKYRHTVDSCHLLVTALDEKLVKKVDGKYYLANGEPLVMDFYKCPLLKHSSLKSLSSNARHRTPPTK